MFFSRGKKQLYIGLVLLLLAFICSKNTVHAAFGDATGLSSYQYWGKQLTAEEYRIYNEMVKSAERGERKTLQMEYHFEHIWDLGEDGIRQYVSNMVARAYSAFTYDYPLYRPANYSYTYTLEANAMELTVSFEEFYDGFWTDLSEVKTKIFQMEEKILQNYSQNLAKEKMEGVLTLELSLDYEDFLLVEEIYRQVIKNTVYSFAIDTVTEELTDLETFSVSAAVLDKFNRHSVCSGYSGLFQILCNDLGISCIQVCNDGNSFETAHSYNFVCLGDLWYMVDPTWGDDGEQIDWDSFLCGGKVSLDGRRLGNQLANPYVVTGFLNPALADCFYKTLAFEEMELSESILYDAKDFSASPYSVDVTTHPFSEAVMENLQIEAKGIQTSGRSTSSITVNLDMSCDFSLCFSGKYMEEERTADLQVIRYPLYESKDDYIAITGLGKEFIPTSIVYDPMYRYRFQTEGSDTVFTMEEDLVGHFLEGEDILSLECTEGVWKGFELPLSYKKEERRRSVSDPLFIISFPKWNEALHSGKISLSLSEVITLSEWSEERTFYVVGCDEKGTIEEIGEVVLSNGMLSDFIPESPVLFFYETPWKQSDSGIYLYVAVIGGIVCGLILWIVFLFGKRHRIEKTDENQTM